jgi:hypothetical protein
MPAENSPDLLWTAAEENVLTLARELEWAEAYAVDNPICPFSKLYLDFLHWEMINAQSEL